MLKTGFILLLAGLAWSPFAHAQATVECASNNHQYDECYAGMLRAPQLVNQISNAACIVNRTWGFNRQSGYIWVADGCRGVFADVGGYHHGRGDTYDSGARHYDEYGHDTGKVVAGMVLGAILSNANNATKARTEYRYTTSNVDHSRNNYTGCHGIGCMVDKPDDNQSVDTRPQYDKNGEPNFDTKGNYQGCHGVGCLVDTPDDSSSDSSDSDSDYSDDSN